MVVVMQTTSVPKRAKKIMSNERWEGNTARKQRSTWSRVMRMMQESVSSLFNQKR
jgi:hypothetical protein